MVIFSNFSKPGRFLQGLSLIAEHSRIPLNIFGKKSPRYTMRLGARFALI
jgi:hypothetical protein